MDIQKIIETMSGNMVAKLNRIRLFLNEGRASVMVGAGFSRNAEKEAHVVVKDWNSLAEDIYEQLYAKRPTAKDLAFKTPMRLASLLASNVGRNGLDQVIKDSLPDDLIEPGKLHYQLMELNWRDVFTTNYDTLLERAAEKSGRYYKVITSKEMLLYKSSPRIIKLHGSFPDKTPFLMTEEEFRTYPIDHPEFVNTVRQALVESVFCLIGFSGDDPNFTSWQAWLRDVMGDYASPTYLITYDTNYDDSFKKLMMTRGVEVLNLAEIKGLNDFKSALEFFFTYLGQKQVVEWKPYTDYSWKVDDINKLIEELKGIRESYPGWFVLPREYYKDFRDMEVVFPYFQNVIESIADDGTKEELLFELDWRADISLSFKDYEWYIQSLEGLVEKNLDKTYSEKMMSLALSLLRLYRHHPEKTEQRERLESSLRTHLLDMTEGQKRRYYYTLACNMLSVLDYDSLEQLIREWKPRKNDYDGIIYKALVIAETKGVSEASVMIGEALERISRVLLKETSEELLSKKAALEFLLSFYSNEKRPDIPPKYSFLALSEHVMSKCRVPDSLEEDDSHGFAIGSMGRTWNIRSGVNPHFLYPYRYLLLCERFGLPHGLPRNTVDHKLLAEIVELLSGFGVEYTMPIALRSGSRNVAETAFSRTVLSDMSHDQAEALTIILLALTNKAAPDVALSFRIKEVLLPILCRLSTKITGVLRKEVFKAVCTYFKKEDNKAIADVGILYDGFMPDDLPDVIDTLFSRDFDIDLRGRDFPYPSIGYDSFTPKEEQLDIVLDGLKSGNEDMLLAVFSRLECLINSKITDDQRKRIDKAVIDWRKNSKASRYYWISFALVKADKTEVAEIRDDIDQILDRILSTNYSFNGSSIEISGLTEELKRLSEVAKLLTDKQKIDLFEKIAKILDDNRLIISRDDSLGLMGGMRKFFIELFSAIKSLVWQIGLTDTDKKASKDLFISLSNFKDDGLPVRVIMELLNNHCKAMKSNKMREVIETALFSDNRKVLFDSLNALVLHAKNGGNVQTAYQRIIHFCATDITVSTYAYIDCLAYSDFAKLTRNTKNELGKMMIALYERLPKANLTAEYKADLAHSCVALLKTIQKETGVSSIKDASKLWIDYVNNPDTFEDVKRAYYE